MRFCTSIDLPQVSIRRFLGSFTILIAYSVQLSGCWSLVALVNENRTIGVLGVRTGGNGTSRCFQLS